VSEPLYSHVLWFVVIHTMLYEWPERQTALMCRAILSAASSEGVPETNCPGLRAHPALLLRGVFRGTGAAAPHRAANPRTTDLPLWLASRVERRLTPPRPQRSLLCSAEAGLRPRRVLLPPPPATYRPPRCPERPAPMGLDSNNTRTLKARQGTSGLVRQQEGAASAF